MPSAGTSATINLGAEYDDDLRGAVRDILRGLDAKRLNHTWRVGGSQVIETWTFEVEGETVVFEAETYIGLTVRG